MGAVTTEQQALIEAIARKLERDPRVEAVWLAGSLGRGAGDRFSDVDILALAETGAAGAVSADVAADIGAIAPPGLVNSLYGGRVLNVVTEDWRRFDITFVEAADLVRYDAAKLAPLFNRTGAQPPRARQPYRPSAEAALARVNEYLRVRGTASVVLGREEYVVALGGMDLLRRMTIELMLDENGVGPADRGGALRLNSLLTAEQRAALEALPPVAPNLESLQVTSAAIDALFLPRARRLGEALGMTWPAAFEAATRRHLKASLGADLEASPTRPMT